MRASVHTFARSPTERTSARPSHKSSICSDEFSSESDEESSCETCGVGHFIADDREEFLENNLSVVRGELAITILINRVLDVLFDLGVVQADVTLVLKDLEEDKRTTGHDDRVLRCLSAEIPSTEAKY